MNPLARRWRGRRGGRDSRSSRLGSIICRQENLIPDQCRATCDRHPASLSFLFSLLGFTFSHPSLFSRPVSSACDPVVHSFEDGKKFAQAQILHHNLQMSMFNRAENLNVYLFFFWTNFLTCVDGYLFCGHCIQQEHDKKLLNCTPKIGMLCCVGRDFG